jgi:cyclopropane fatty-acyl-phospholipid synthase-like methyltransferase
MTRMHAPAAARNREPIAQVLREVIPPRSRVLEVASGSGEHALYLAPRLDVDWQPTDLSDAALASIEAWRAQADLERGAIAAPLRLDATEDSWPVAVVDAVVCFNMIHIAPWVACEGLVRGASRVLAPSGPLVLYGPFVRDGFPTAPSNEAFDASLRSRDPSWGVRHLAEVTRLAETNGFSSERVVEMPANNLTVVFRRRET